MSREDAGVQRDLEPSSVTSGQGSCFTVGAQRAVRPGSDHPQGLAVLSSLSQIGDKAACSLFGSQACF